MSTQDVQFAIRTLRRSPAFAAVAILTIAIGVGATSAIASAVDAALVQPLPYQQPGQLVRLYQADTAHPNDRNFVTPVHYLAFRSRLASFSAVAAIFAYSESGADIGTGETARRIRVLPVSSDYFDVTRVAPVLGRGFRREEEDDAAVVILSNELWQHQYEGNSSLIGRVIDMNGAPRTVIGVMPRGYRDPVVGAIDAWTPADLREGKDPSNVNNHYITVIGRLRPTVPIARAQAELDLLMASMAREYPNASRYRSVARLYPLKDDIVGGATRSYVLMLGAAILVLVLVCVNVANLLLVRGSERARELAVRSALGASQSRLVKQMLIESVALALAGGVAGLVVARGTMAVIVAIGAGSMPRIDGMQVDAHLLIAALLLSTVSAIGFGLGPALRLARSAPREVLQEQGRSFTGGRREMRVRQWLVVAQVALAFVLLVGAGVLLASFSRLRELDLGLRTDHVLTYELHLPEARYDSTARARLYEQIAARTKALPGVVAAGGISKLPATGQYHEWGVEALTGPLVGSRRSNIGGQNRVISGDYFSAVRIPIVDGRVFDARDDERAPNRVVVSRELAEQLYPGVRAVGQRLNTGNHDSEIIGVVGDVAVDAEGRVEPYVYHAHRQFAGDRNWALIQTVRTTGDPNALQKALRQTVASLDPQLVMYKPMTLDDAIGRGEAQRLFTLRMLTAFAAVALALAALGLFGVLSYGVRLRTREFGIRMALGAEAGSVRALVLREALTVTGLGVALGVGGAVALSRVIASAAFQTAPLDPWVLASVVAFIAVVAGVAAYVPAHRATTVDPRTALQ
jgi:putative ABC transport system permease protein